MPVQHLVHQIEFDVAIGRRQTEIIQVDHHACTLLRKLRAIEFDHVLLVLLIVQVLAYRFSTFEGYTALGDVSAGEDGYF